MHQASRAFCSRASCSLVPARAILSKTSIPSRNFSALTSFLDKCTRTIQEATSKDDLTLEEFRSIRYDKPTGDELKALQDLEREFKANPEEFEAKYPRDTGEKRESKLLPDENDGRELSFKDIEHEIRSLYDIEDSIAKNPQDLTHAPDDPNRHQEIESEEETIHTYVGDFLAEEAGRQLYTDQLEKMAEASTRRALSPQELSNQVTFHAQLGIRNDELFESVAQASMDIMDEFDGWDLSNTMFAFAKMDIKNVALFEKAATSAAARLDTFQVQHIANLAVAFSIMEFKHDELFEKVAVVAGARLSEFEENDLSNLVDATRGIGFTSESFESLVVAAKK